MDLGCLDIRNFLEKAETTGCLIVGDIILDKYIYGEVNRISPEAPIPIVNVLKEKYVLGGAANVAGNICGYHLNAYLCGLLGDDENAIVVKQLLTDKKIDFVGITSSKRCTTMKTRVVGMNQQLVRIDQEVTTELDMEEEKNLLQQVVSVLPKVQVVVLSDYNKGVCSESFCKRLMKVCQESGKLVIVDPKSDDWTKYKGAYLITPNFKEFQEVIGRTLDNTEAMISKKAISIIEKYELSQVLVTRSQFGMTLVKRGGDTLTFASVQQEVFDVSGAGDTVIATIAAMIAIGAKLEDALEVSNYAAGLAVSKAGSYVVTLEEVLEYLNHFGLGYKDKIWDADKIYTMLQIWKNSHEKLVFTNGCFDILHIGHIDYLNRARLLGDKMIVGLNTDASVKRLKGTLRPINNQEVRALALAALQCVDAVIMFDDDTPEELIKLIKPDFLVKGGDYKLEDIVGREYAREVCTIPLTEGYSTTKLLEKIQQGGV